ncbi:CDP-alcohol phosphatidyltransferase family protein [Henriciella aquimarina]|uniref:CDP-alcohol phosphatidyltransferase family protein n=1 Tax=Henriciella aquimarina TaxID=545261 RepID=UPI0009FC2CF0|nr:CDP-alcohol phosphatidyltransferase family protein [Henriciella aquimarina]
MGLSWLPNAVTIARCVLAIWVGYAILQLDIDLRGGREAGLWLFVPFVVFTLTAASDWLDGALARKLDAESRFGARIDPIADKLLAASSLLALCYIERWALYIAIPALAIIVRDFLLTAMREALGNPSTLKVSNAAKWKTTIVLTSIGGLLFGAAVSEYAHHAPEFSPLWLVTRGLLLAGIAGLWFAALLSVMTAINYVSAAARPGR